MTRKSSHRWLLAGALLLAAWGLSACESLQPKSREPARLFYLQAQAFADQELYGDAVERLNKLIEQNPGTLLAAYGYFKLARINELQDKWNDAETNYRIFLTLNRDSDLTSFVLYRLIVAQYKRSFTGLIFEEQDIERDVEPHRKIMREYARFFFLYPKSVFLPEVREYYRASRKKLADYERMVGDFYFDRSLYNAAAFRYLYLLRNFPDYPEAQAVLRSLVRAYRRNQQPELAEEMARLLEQGARKAPVQPPSSNGAMALPPEGLPAPRLDDSLAHSGPPGTLVPARIP